MNPNRSKARLAGIFYALMGSTGAFNLLYIPAAFIVPGDAAATARRITDSVLTYRIAVLSGLVSLIAFVLLVVTLYNLFKDVDRTQSMLMVIFVTVAVAGGVLNLVNQIAPLVVLSGEDFLSVLTGPQRDALALGFLKLNGYGNVFEEAFWGLWLFPLGVLVWKSGFIPRILGIFLILACFAYLAASLTSIAVPAQGRTVFLAATPFEALGEISFLVWLLVRGTKAQSVAAATEQPS
jgi:uncharacterized membrane protein YwzB